MKNKDKDSKEHAIHQMATLTAIRHHLGKSERSVVDIFLRYESEGCPCDEKMIAIIDVAVNEAKEICQDEQAARFTAGGIIKKENKYRTALGWERVFKSNFNEVDNIEPIK